MKALTLIQPWATLVAIGAKRIETRSWSTNYRGILAIHAAKRFPKWARELTLEPIYYTTVNACRSVVSGYPTGVVVATCRLVTVLPVELVDNERNVFNISLEPLSPRERVFGDYTPGRFAWILEDAKELAKPIPAKGALGLWEWSPVKAVA